MHPLLQHVGTSFGCLIFKVKSLRVAQAESALPQQILPLSLTPQPLKIPALTHIVTRPCDNTCRVDSLANARR